MRTTAKAGLTLLIVVVGLKFLTDFEFGLLVEKIRQVNTTLVVIAGVVYSVSWPIRGKRYKDILKRIGFEGGLGFLTGAVFISQTGNLIFPARAGDAARAYMIKSRRSIPYSSGFASLAVERLFDLLAVTFLGGVALTWFLINPGSRLTDLVYTGTADPSALTALIASVLVGVGTVVVFGLLVMNPGKKLGIKLDPPVSSPGFGYVSKIIDAARGFLNDTRSVVNDKKAFVGLSTVSLLIWSLDVLTGIIVFVAFGVQLPLVDIVFLTLLGVSVGNLSKTLPLSPGGIGLYEAGFGIIVVSLSPLTWTIAIGVAIVDHAVKNLVTVVGGVFSVLLLNVSLTRAVDEAKSERSKRKEKTV
ncbi:MAG: lysylphosphatidylglycerol synthase transmembrane domain-containing protein [Halobacteria archaeon]|nr:lysylphosphatidylglycerol synthase transmembrane domain-containing protein [Halobacteria archaeon]